MAHLKLIKGRYYGYYRISNGRYKSQSLKTSNPTAAKQRLKELEKLEYEISIGVRQVQSHDENVQQLPLSKVVAAFLLDQKNLIRASTLQRYEDSLNELMAVFGKEKDIRSFRRSDYAILTNALISAQKPIPNTRELTNRFTHTTVNIMLRGIRRFFNWAVENDYLDKIPFKVRMLKLEKKPPKFMTDDEVIRFMEKAASNSPLMKIFEIYLETGMRLSELENSKLMPDKLHISITHTKGYSERIVPIPAHLVSDYEQLRDRSYDKSYLEHRFKLYAKEAGLSSELTFHSLRHTFAVRHWVKYHDINLTKEVLGHSSVTVTEIYTKIPATYLANVIATRHKNQ
jgi:integrase/recombinase XerD